MPDWKISQHDDPKVGGALPQHALQESVIAAVLPVPKANSVNTMEVTGKSPVRETPVDALWRLCDIFKNENAACEIGKVACTNQR